MKHSIGHRGRAALALAGSALFLCGALSLSAPLAAAQPSARTESARPVDSRARRRQAMLMRQEAILRKEKAVLIRREAALRQQQAVLEQRQAALKERTAILQQRRAELSRVQVRLKQMQSKLERLQPGPGKLPKSGN